MITRKLRKNGDSFIICLPSHVCEIMEMKTGDDIGIDLEKGKIVLVPPPDANHGSGTASTTEAPAHE